MDDINTANNLQQQQQQEFHYNNQLWNIEKCKCFATYSTNQQPEQQQQHQQMINAYCTCPIPPPQQQLHQQQQQQIYYHSPHQQLLQQPQQQQYFRQQNNTLILPTCYAAWRKKYEPVNKEYDYPTQNTDDEDSAFVGIHNRELNVLHQNVPALRRTGINTTAISQNYYPDGGWGWIICGISFLTHILTSGLQLSYGFILFYAVQHFPDTNGIEWLGVLSWSISLFASPFVVSLCRKKSIRLLAVIGAFMQALGMLFTSFATEMNQMIFSYCILFALGASIVRESSTLMLGNYFKRNRKFVEMIAMSGEGIGISFFSVIIKEGLGKGGWRFGLQMITILIAISIFLGICYRPASIYHPQRRAIQHLKNQRKKLRVPQLPGLSPKQTNKKYFSIDLSPFKSATVRLLLTASAVSAFGIYTPIFLLCINAAKEGFDIQDLVLLQTLLGLSLPLGVAISGALLRRPIKIKHFQVNTKIVSQIFTLILAVSILNFSFVKEFRTLCILSLFYGLGLGGLQYCLKMLALERIKLKHFSQTWGLMKAVQSLPVLISVPLTSILNDYSLKYGRAGYYICSAAAAITGIIVFFINIFQRGDNYVKTLRKHQNTNTLSLQRSCPYRCNSTSSLPYLTGSAYHYSHSEPIARNANVSYVTKYFAQKSEDYQVPQRKERTASQSRSPVCAQSHNCQRRRQSQLPHSLPFFHQPHCCQGQWIYNDNQLCRISCVIPRLNMVTRIECTCPSEEYLPCNQTRHRSRSVPEDLYALSEQSSSYKCQDCLNKQLSYDSRNAKVLQSRQQRSQSLSRPLHYVDKVTTSV